MNKELVIVPDVLKAATKISLYKGYALEGIPNRDATKYESMYGIEFENLFRGTLRYQGYSSIMIGFKLLGLLNLEEDSDIASGKLSWPSLLKKLTMAKDEKLDAVLIKCAGQDVYECLKWLGLLDEKTKVTISKGSKNTPLDALCSVLEIKLNYGQNERLGIWSLTVIIKGYGCHA